VADFQDSACAFWMAIAWHFQIDGWIVSERGANAAIVPLYEILPGNNLPPEQWVLEQLAFEDYRISFAEQLVAPVIKPGSISTP